jgi:hypothetical protein
VTDHSPGPSSGPTPPQATDLFGALSARQDAAVERLTQAVAKVMAEAARTDAAARAAQVESLEGVMARIVREAAVQTGLVERAGQTSQADAEALRSALSTGFNRVGDRITEALRSEVTRLETALAPRAEIADSVVSAVRDQLLAAVRELEQDTVSTLDSGFASMRATLAEVAHDGRSSFDAVVALGTKGLEPLRNDLMAVTEVVGAELTALRQVIETAAHKETGDEDERAERLRTELIVSLGALQEAVRSPVEALAEAFGQSVQSLLDAMRAEATAREASFAAVAHQVDQLTASTKAIAGAQDELRRLVAQLWGGEVES